MTRNLMELSIAVFFIVLSAGMVVSGLFVKDVLYKQLELSEQQVKQQADIIESANNTKDMLTDVAFALAARNLESQGMLSPTDADKIATDSISKVSASSERMGLLLKALNDALQRDQSAQ